MDNLFGSVAAAALCLAMGWMLANGLDRQLQIEQQQTFEVAAK